MMVGEITAILLLISSILFIWALKATHTPKSRQVSILLERGEYVLALAKAVDGLGMIPWGWVVKPQHSALVVHWLAVNEEMKEMAMEAIAKADLSPDRVDTLREFFQGVSEAEDIARRILTKQLLSYSEREWNALWLNNSSIRIRALRGVQR